MMRDEQPDSFSMRARLKSFRYAFAGLRTFFATQHNAIIHLALTIAVLLGAVFFRLSKAEWIAIILVMGFVWTAELFNTAIEKLSDMVSEEFHPTIKFIKDVAAAAVLVSAVAAFLTGALIFIPKV